MSSSDSRFLLIGVAKASLIETVTLFALVWLVVWLGIPSTNVEELVMGIAFACMSCAVATWWIYRSLKMRCSRRDARAAATAFAVFAPVSMALSLPFAQIPGGYAGLLGSSFGLAVAIISVFVTNTLLSFAVSVFVLRMKRHIEGTQKVQ